MGTAGWGHETLDDEADETFSGPLVMKLREAEAILAPMAGSTAAYRQTHS